MTSVSAERDPRNPRLPSDLGLPTLGLLMQLMSGVASAYGALIGFMLLVNHGYGKVRLTVLIVVIAGWVRGVFHATAGRRVIERSPELLRAVRNYLIAAAVTTAIMIGAIMLLGGGLLSPLFHIALVVLAAAWPAALSLLVFRQRVRAMFETAEGFDIDVRAPDRSIEGVGVLMTAFGGIGLGVGLLLLYVFVSVGGDAVASLIGIAVLAMVVVLVVRSSFHLAGGIRASAGVPPDEFGRLVDRYHLWGLLSVVALGLVIVVFLGVMGSRGLLQMMIIGVIAAVLLMLWPMTLRRFANGLLFHDQLHEHEFGQPVTTLAGVAPDRGLTAFGYLLVFFASAQGSLVVVQLLVASVNGAGLVATAFGGTSGWGLLSGLASTTVTLWAGVELVQMSTRHRLAMIVYGVVSLALALISLATGELAAIGRELDQAAPALLIAEAIALVTPIMALVLANRRLPA